MRQAEKEKKNLVPNSIHTRSGQENSEKNSKKIQKILKPLSGNIYKNSEKNSTKFKKLKYIYPALVFAKTG